MSVADLRSSYERAALSEGDVADDPLVQFDRWFQETLGGEVPEPNAMTLSTVGADGRPSSRIVLLKGYDRDGAADAAGGSSPAPRGGLVWFTNYQSKKGIELAIHPHACLLFHWIALERQVRIEGCTERISAAESDRYFESRPLGSRIGAWASPQSQVVASRQVLEEEAAALALRFGETVPRPPQWGGYRLIPDYFEFWQGRPSRLHDRLCYRRGTDGRWSMRRLAP